MSPEERLVAYLDHAAAQPRIPARWISRRMPLTSALTPPQTPAGWDVYEAKDGERLDDAIERIDARRDGARAYVIVFKGTSVPAYTADTIFDIIDRWASRRRIVA